MASTFAGLSITSRALNAAQIGLTTTTNNMANIDTTGYSKQVVSQKSIGPAAVYSNNLVGAGVEVNSVDRTRSAMLDQKYWQENSAASKAEATSDCLTQIESILGTTSSSYITTSLDSFETALSTLSSDVKDSSARSTVLTDAENLCSTLNDAADALTQLRNDLNTEVSDTVNQINSYADQIGALNQQISQATAAGASTNELEDSRDLAVDKLSALVGVTATADDDGNLDITVNGVSLVNGDIANKLECYTVTDTSSSEYGEYGIRWADSGKTFNVSDSGALSGYLEMRDGSSQDSKGITYYLSKLDDFARTLAKAFNEGVTSGSTTYNGNADGYGLDDSTGIRFFTYDSVSSSEFMTSGSTTDAIYQNITASNISVSKDIQEDTDKIAASSESGADSNTDNLNDLIAICEKANVSGTCTMANVYNLLVADVAGSSTTASSDYDRKSARATYINTSRSSVSGVSSDEETVNMTTYEQAYAASASLTSKWSEIYATTINMVNTD